MAHRSGVFGGNSTPARAHVNLSYRIADWSFPLVRKPDSAGLPSTSTALAILGGTGESDKIRETTRSIVTGVMLYLPMCDDTLSLLSLREALVKGYT